MAMFGWGWQAMAAEVATAIGVSQDGGVKGVVVTMVMMMIKKKATDNRGRRCSC